ncbi:hypothetical protein EV13_0239 [Prochlorococcus sp. MIT 0702]|nr:hypothetical protein EV13_0239 [Prochlorococcus sp. MIT 0702]
MISAPGISCRLVFQLLSHSLIVMTIFNVGEVLCVRARLYSLI